MRAVADRIAPADHEPASAVLEAAPECLALPIGDRHLSGVAHEQFACLERGARVVVVVGVGPDVARGVQYASSEVEIVVAGGTTARNNRASTNVAVHGSPATPDR